MQVSSTSDTVHRSRRSQTVRRRSADRQTDRIRVWIRQLLLSPHGSRVQTGSFVGPPRLRQQSRRRITERHRSDQQTEHGPIRCSQTEDLLRGVPLHLLRRRPAKGSGHLQDHDHIPGRRIQHGRQVQERFVQLRPEQHRGLRQIRVDQGVGG